MAPSPPAAGLSFKEIVPIICSVAGLAVLLGGVLRADGGRDEKVDQTIRRVAILEAADISKTELLTKIDGRTIRIETKLEIIAPSKGVQP